MRPYYSLPPIKPGDPAFFPPGAQTGGWRGEAGWATATPWHRHPGGNRLRAGLLVPYKTTSTLPTGYLKRLELARCLALKPELILCDEVFSGLSMSEIASMVPLIERSRWTASRSS